MSSWGRARWCLVVQPTIVPDPACLVPAAGVTVRPVHHTSLRAPLVLATQRDRVARGDRHARREVEVVSDEHADAAGDLENESLVPCALPVVRKHANDAPNALDLHVRPSRAI